MKSYLCIIACLAVSGAGVRGETNVSFADVEYASQKEGWEIGGEVSVTGIAGYVNNKGGDPCLWIAEGYGDYICLRINIVKWVSRLAGKPVTISGILKKSFGPTDDGAQQRNEEGEVYIASPKTQSGTNPSEPSEPDSGRNPFK